MSMGRCCRFREACPLMSANLFGLEKRTCAMYCCQKVLPQHPTYGRLKPSSLLPYCNT